MLFSIFVSVGLIMILSVSNHINLKKKKNGECCKCDTIQLYLNELIFSIKWIEYLEYKNDIN